MHNSESKEGSGDENERCAKSTIWQINSVDLRKDAYIIINIMGNDSNVSR
jgi:hypothetical protein